MTAAAAEEDVEEDVDEPSEDVAEDAAESEGEQPSIEDDEQADLSALAEQVQAETAPATDESDSSDSSDDTGGESDDGDETDGEDVETPGESYGDMYVKTLCSVSNAVIDEYGEEGEEDVDPEMARQLGLDDAIDELMAQRGQPDMPPEHQVLIGTLVFAVTVAGAKTDLFDRLLAEADL